MERNVLTTTKLPQKDIIEFQGKKYRLRRYNSRPVTIRHTKGIILGITLDTGEFVQFIPADQEFPTEKSYGVLYSTIAGLSASVIGVVLSKPLLVGLGLFWVILTIVLGLLRLGSEWDEQHERIMR